MTTTHSAAPAFKAALVARLVTALAPVTVTYGPPTPGEFTEREWVWAAGLRSTQVTAAIGSRRREEVWEQDVIVSCIRTQRNDHQDLTERAYAISALIEDSLRSWSAPGAAFDGIVRTALVTAQDLEEFTGTERESRLTVRITCTQRI